MAFSDEEIREALRKLTPKPPIQIYPAIVKSIQGNNCTVDILGTDLVDVPDVNLRADDEAEEGVLLVPRVGSYIYIGAVENASDNLFVCMVSEVDSIQAVIDNTTITIDANQVHAVRDQCELTLTDKAVLKQGQTTIELSNNKVKIANSGVNLKDLFTDLTTLLQSFTVTCSSPGSPSAPFPATVSQVTQLSTKVNLLLQ